MSNCGHLRLRIRIATKGRNIPVLQIDFKASTFGIERNAMMLIHNLTMERDFRKILASNVEVNFKVALIMCNQLGWRMEFDFYHD